MNIVSFLNFKLTFLIFLKFKLSQQNPTVNLHDFWQFKPVMAWQVHILEPAHNHRKPN